MDEKLEQAIKELTEKAKLTGKKSKPSRWDKEYSSLHQIIKTKEQAERFMKQLHALQ
jgi:hypothetical protein